MEAYYWTSLPSWQDFYQHVMQLLHAIHKLALLKHLRNRLDPRVLNCCALQEARAKVRAMFGSCHGGDEHGPTYSLAAVDPPLLSLMARFRSESGAELQLPEGALRDSDLGMQDAHPGAADVACSAQRDTPAPSPDGDMEAVVMSERGHCGVPDADGAGVGRLRASGRVGGGRYGGDLRESGASVKSAGARGAVRMMERAVFGSSAVRLSSGEAIGRGSTGPVVTGNGLPGSATRIRAAARKALV